MVWYTQFPWGPKHPMGYFSYTGGVVFTWWFFYLLHDVFPQVDIAFIKGPRLVQHSLAIGSSTSLQGRKAFLQLT